LTQIVAPVFDADIFCSQLSSISTLGNHLGRKMIQLGFEMSEMWEKNTACFGHSVVSVVSSKIQKEV